MSATAATSTFRHAQPQGDGLYLIDTDYVRPGLAAAHLLVDDGHAAFIDTGPGPAAPKLMRWLPDECAVRVAHQQPSRSDSAGFTRPVTARL